MNGFFLTKLVVSGPKLPDAVINLNDGVNIIYGPSNTGKTYVLKCIDYLFGAGTVPIDEGSGYISISMHVCSRSGGKCVIRRNINERKVTIADSSISYIEDGEYTINKFKQLCLRFIGISDSVKLIAKQDYSKTQSLSWRMLEPMFFIQEEHIFRSDSIITTPGFKNITVSLSALKYCYDGKQVEIPDMGDKNAAAISRKAVITYISGQIGQLKDEKRRIEEAIAAFGDVDLETIILEQSTKLDHLNQETQRFSDQSKELLQSKIVLSDKLHELEYMRDRFAVLAEGYRSDIERLEFIIDGEQVRPQQLKKIRCPFCSGDMQPKQHKSLAVSAGKELKNVEMQLMELQAVIETNNEEILELQNQIRDLEDKQAALSALIKGTYKTQVANAQKSIQDLEELQRMRARLAYICEISKEYDSDIQAYEDSKEISLSYDVKNQLGDAFYDVFNQYLDEALRICKYDNFTSCHLNKADFDVVVDGRKKRNQGKGYRAFLNTVMAYCILKLLSLQGAYSPGMLILASPILSLKEKNEQTSAEMKENLFRMILNTEFPCQIIIAENDIPNIDYSNANMIHFTKNSGLDRYGFLKEV